MEKQVLALLREEPETFISGQSMSRLLGVSRTMIWKTVQSLRKRGFVIDSSANKGYKLSCGPERLLDIDIEIGLGTAVVGRSVISFESVPSTIDVAGRLAAEGADEGTVVVAESQSGGRGRLGRKWSSPRGAGIWTSIILRPSIPPHDAPKLTLLTAVAITTVLQKCYGIEARIKWPNDVVVARRKICGALTELVAEQDAVRYAIISFGLNVNQTKSRFPAEVADIATSMRIETGKRHDRPEVFRHILRELDKVYERFRQDSGAAILDRWRELSCTLGRKVAIRLRDESVEGIARDLADDGSLIIEMDNKTVRQISYGDVTILR
jgi:BirA family biotin operon repressor/biotin-[acetyl-CoA-carboxylase] ligase